MLGPPVGGYRAPIDPLTVGRVNGQHFLLDGYHRAAIFWNYGPSDGNVAA